ncbi:DUF6804 family protein [Subtercola boreus]|uniref:DUF6804 family protein n=1 Tax=Subtercola boreus TaxID=120213 RepID=UPI00209C6A51|nr:DUF6804 family protein [Subtercola boreus]
MNKGQRDAQLREQQERNRQLRNRPTGATPASRYPTFTRTALAPGLLAAVILLAAVAVIDSGWFTLFRYAIAILALIVSVFAYQAKQWWWIIGLVPIAVVWNPIVPLDFVPPVWYALHLAAAIVFVAAGLLIKIPVSNAK